MVSERVATLTPRGDGIEMPPISRRMHAVKNSKALLESLNSKKIFFDKADGMKRLIAVPTLYVPEGPSVEPQTGFFGGTGIHQMGAFSYSYSNFPPHTIRIGRYCSIAGGVTVMGTGHQIDYLTTSAALYEKVIFVDTAFSDEEKSTRKFFPNPQKAWPTIGHDVWIGADAMIGRAISIGHGAVVAAGALVTKDVPPYAIVGGNPARVIRLRFPEKTVEKLLTLEWWRFRYPDFCHLSVTEIDRFIDEISEMEAVGKISSWLPHRVDVWELAKRVEAAEQTAAE